jgi:hypothetical protein
MLVLRVITFLKLLQPSALVEADLTGMIDDADAGCIHRDQNSELYETMWHVAYGHCNLIVMAKIKTMRLYGKHLY